MQSYLNLNVTLNLKVILSYQCGIICKCVKYIGKFVCILLLSFGLFCLTSYIAMKFIDVCIDGQSSYTEPTLLCVIFLEIFFRKMAYQWLGDSAWFLPGIRLKEAYRLFLPIYYFYIGSCIV